jgi:hypothetical protein
MLIPRSIDLSHPLRVFSISRQMVGTITEIRPNNFPILFFLGIFLSNEAILSRGAENLINQEPYNCMK